MHIPDGYLGPTTYGAMFGVMIPIWAVASRKLNKSLKAKQAPYLALGAAFSFLIMMFNIPAIGKTTGHATGATLIAVFIGPWASVIAVSVALAMQFLIFKDGGVTTFGANCFNIAFIGAFAGYGIYRLIAGHSSPLSRRRWIAGAVAAYVSLNISALLTAIQLGIQPLIAKTADGKPMFSPFPLSVTVPVMAFEHLLIFGLVEATVTALVIKYFQKNDPAMLGQPEGKGTK